MTHALLFFTEFKSMFANIASEIGYEIEIESIAYPVSCRAQQRNRLCTAPVLAAGTDPHDRQSPAGATHS